MMERNRFNKALLDPADVFVSPAEVLLDGELSRDEKIEVLRRWAYEADELGVAEAEGMPGHDGELLRQTLMALHQLAREG